MPYVDYQQRATEFSVGDKVYTLWGESTDAKGRVVAVWPAIGMVDVEWPHGSERLPVEDLQLQAPDDRYKPPEIEHSNVPGGAGSVSVSGGPESLESVSKSAKSVEALEEEFYRWVHGPVDDHDLAVEVFAAPLRVAHAFVKKALYWASADRQYKATRAEVDSGGYTCPKCKEHGLLKTTYKRRNGQSDRLLGCPNCLFLIKREDIIGDPGYIEYDPESEKQPFHRIRLTAGGGV